jgi:hypothetical protein
LLGQFAVGQGFEGEIWNNSDAPEVQLIETELAQRRFDGIISLRAILWPIGSRQASQLKTSTLSLPLLPPRSKLFLPMNVLRSQSFQFASFVVPGAHSPTGTQ